MKPGIFPAPSSGGGQPTITTTNDELGSDVAMTTAATWYDGPSHALAAGTYLVEADAEIAIGTNSNGAARIWDGTTIYAQGGGNTGNILAVHLAVIIVLASAATIKVSCAANSSASTLKAADAVIAGSGNHATRLSTLKLA